MIIWGTPLILFFIPAHIINSSLISDNEFNLLITAGLAGTFVGSFLYPILDYRSSSTRSLVRNSVKHNGSAHVPAPAWALNGGTLIYVSFLAYSVVSVVYLYGGVLPALSVGRLEEYLKGGILEGRTITLFMILPEILFYIYVGKILEEGKPFLAFCLVILLAIYHVFTANTRFPMIMPLFAFGIVLVNRIRRRWVFIAMPMIICGGILSIFSFNVIGNLIRSGSTTDVATVLYGFWTAVELQSSTDLGYYDWLHDLYTAIENGGLELEYGASWFYYAVINFIPRSLWAAKPITSTSNRLTEAVYGVYIGEGAPVTTFTILGEGYWQGGYFGVAIAALLFFSLYHVLLSRVIRLKYSEYWVAMILLEMATFYRGELPVTRLLLILLLLSVLRVAGRVRFLVIDFRNSIRSRLVS